MTSHVGEPHKPGTTLSRRSKAPKKETPECESLEANNDTKTGEDVVPIHFRSSDVKSARTTGELSHRHNTWFESTLNVHDKNPESTTPPLHHCSKEKSCEVGGVSDL